MATSRRLSALVLLACAALASPGRAEPARPDKDVEAAAAADAALRTWLARHLEDEQAAVTAAAQATDEKVAAARAVLSQRAAVAYRVLRHTARTSSAPSVTAAAPPAPTPSVTPAVRSRAAARWLLARDRDELALLVGERALLTSSFARLVAAATRVALLPLPPRQLPWPAPGTIARGFGPFAHERSGATLSRRGLDLEVAEEAPARAMAAGAVVFAGPIRGLDHGVLVDHGAYLTLIGKLAELSVVTGDAVTAGQPLGKAARRRLYLELRLPLVPAGIPIDPAPFLAER